MKATGNTNINTRTYWNGIYGDEGKRAMYEAQGTDHPVHLDDGRTATASHTARFLTAASYVKDGDKVIDIGCGIGAFTRLVKEIKKDCEIWGTDISDQAIKDNLKIDPDIKYLHRYIGEQDDLPENYFDVVFTGEVLEHMEDPSVLLKDCARILKKGGTLVLTTPNENHIQSHEHTWFFEKEDVDNLFQDAGFEDIKFIDLPDLEWTMVIFCVGKKK